MSSKLLSELFFRKPPLHAAHAGRVDDGAAVRPQEQLAMRRRMAAAAVVRAHLLRRLGRTSQTARWSSVDLPTPDEPMRPTVRLPSKYCSISAMPSPARALMACTGTPGAIAAICSVIPATSSLRSALLRTITGAAPLSATNASKPLDARQIEIAVRRRDDEDDVDVRRQQLRALLARRLADQRAGARQHLLDGGGAVACRQAQRNEVADPGQVGALHGGIAQAPGQLRRQLGRVGGDLKVAAVLADDTARNETFGGVRGEFRLPSAAPAEGLQVS